MGDVLVRADIDGNGVVGVGMLDPATVDIDATRSDIVGTRGSLCVKLLNFILLVSHDGDRVV